jgi:MFS family permease
MVLEWKSLFNLSQTQIGSLQGAGLYPFAISIIAFSFVIDRIGYGRALICAWSGHVLSAIVLISAHSFTQLYAGTLIFSLANGVLESAVNPIVASLYAGSKTSHLNILHAGWPAGMVLGGLLAIACEGFNWRWRVALFLIPTAIYGAMLYGRRFPKPQRVSAAISYRQMLEQFGWLGCLVVSFFIALAIDETLQAFGRSLSTFGIALLALTPPMVFSVTTRKPGRPLFLFLLAIMIRQSFWLWLEARSIDHTTDYTTLKSSSGCEASAPRYIVSTARTLHCRVLLSSARVLTIAGPKPFTENQPHLTATREDIDFQEIHDHQTLLRHRLTFRFSLSFLARRGCLRTQTIRRFAIRTPATVAPDGDL